MNKQAAGYDLLRSIQRYLTPEDMVVEEIGYKDGGNCLLMSSVLILLLKELNRDCFDKLWFNKIVTQCYKKPGLLLKYPTGGFSKSRQTYDDLLAVASACIVIGNREIPRDILKYLLMHFGFYNTTDKLRWDSWLVRHVHMMALLIAASLPWMKYPLYPFLKLISMFMNLNTADASGIQLIWIYHAGCKALGFHFKKYDEVTARLPACFDEYYKSTGMPFKDAARALQ